MAPLDVLFLYLTVFAALVTAGLLDRLINYLVLRHQVGSVFKAFDIKKVEAKIERRNNY